MRLTYRSKDGEEASITLPRCMQSGAPLMSALPAKRPTQVS